MAIDSVAAGAASSAGNSTGKTTASSSSSSASGGLTSAADQEDRFMKLLVAQMKNQDPLNPMDNAQMTSQIAQINTVGGIEKLNTTVTSLLAAFNSMQAQGAAALPGRSVLVEGGTLLLQEAGGTLSAHGGVELAAAADTVNVDVVDSTGAVVRSIALGKQAAGVRNFAWDGVTSSGQAAPAGDYRMRITATAAGKPVGATALTAAQVQAVTNTADGVQLDLGDAGLKKYADVKSFL